MRGAGVRSIASGLGVGISNISILKEGGNKVIDHQYYTLSSADFEQGLNCFTQSRGNINMIVIMGRHYGFFQRLFFKPKVRSLSFHTNIPLFVIHRQNE